MRRAQAARPDRQPAPPRAAPRGSARLASASFASVPDTTQPPFTAVGRVFLKVGNFAGFCSGTAIDSPSRQLVLTAGHCLYSILPGHRLPTPARYFDFVPDYSHGQAPFGEFIGRKGFLPRPWLRCDQRELRHGGGADRTQRQPASTWPTRSGEGCRSPPTTPAIRNTGCSATPAARAQEHAGVRRPLLRRRPAHLPARRPALARRRLLHGRGRQRRPLADRTKAPRSAASPPTGTSGTSPTPSAPISPSRNVGALVKGL